MLLKRIAVNRILQKKREIRVQIEEGPAHKAVRLEGVTVRPRFAVIARKGSEPYSSAIRRIDVAESIDESVVDEVEWNLAGRIEVISPEDKPESEFLCFAQRLRIVRVHVIAPVSPWILEWTIRIRSLIAHI